MESEHGLDIFNKQIEEALPATMYEAFAEIQIITHVTRLQK